MLASPYPFFQSLSREIGQLQSDYRNFVPLTPGQMKNVVSGLRQEYVPLLTDGAFANQLAIVRGNGKVDLMTVVLDPHERALAFYSRFSVPVLSPDYKTEPRNFWAFVLDLGTKIRACGKIPVLTIGDAEWLLDSMIEFGLERLNEVFVFNQDYLLQQKLMDKFWQYQLAGEAGVDMPLTWPGDADFWKEKASLPFPVLVKEQRGKRLFTETGRQAIELFSREELIAAKKEVIGNVPVIVQQKVSDDGSENMFSIGAFRNRHTGHSILFSSRRIRATRVFGSTALSVSEPCPEGVRAARKYLDYIDYHGSCELEFIYDSRQKKLLLLELNPRLYKTQSLATHCGINFNHFALLTAMGKNLPEQPQQIYGPRWWLAWGDIADGIRKMQTGKLSFQEFIEPLSFDFVNGMDELDDPLPGFVNIFNGKF
ncbi:ATP-binding protein [Marinilabilia salmonicolor]|uniref:ATP-binding protein n=1 Tax=Marinilabilia salmonicolor TaxID=989 RepID=UPI00029B2F66|nr:ATP-grasp domain-containing protein [Marinilabilia salmonicolor]